MIICVSVNRKLAQLCVCVQELFDDDSGGGDIIINNGNGSVGTCYC